VTGAEAGPVDLGKMLIAAGWPEVTPLAITWAGTTTEQQTVLTSLGRVGPDLKAAGASVATTYGPAVAIVGAAASRTGRMSWYETKPLFGWRVLVPRTKEQAAVVSERLREYGAVPEEVPTIAVEPPRTPQQMERAVKGLVTGRYQWVAFTSVNAVRAVRERLEEYGLDARAFAGVKVAAVGEQTSKALLAFGGVMHGAFGMGGPTVVLAMRHAVPEKDAFRATLFAFWAVLAVFAMAPRLQHFTWNPLAGLVLLALPIMAAGNWLGHKIAGRVSQRAFARVVATLLVISGIVTITNVWR
jgi:hypothetical protein